VAHVQKGQIQEHHTLRLIDLKKIKGKENLGGKKVEKRYPPRPFEGGNKKQKMEKEK